MVNLVFGGVDSVFSLHADEPQLFLPFAWLTSHDLPKLFFLPGLISVLVLLSDTPDRFGSNHVSLISPFLTNIRKDGRNIVITKLFSEWRHGQIGTHFPMEDDSNDALLLPENP